jgi:hypothetical protein
MISSLCVRALGSAVSMTFCEPALWGQHNNPKKQIAANSLMTG